MKSIQIEKNKWEKINKIVLRVDNVDLIYKQDLTINFVCGFENISRGRCVLLVKEKNKKQIDNLFIHNDKALMEVNIFLDEKKLDNLLYHISLKRNSSKKMKVTISTSDSLMINQKGDLYVDSETKIKINEINWNIPLL
ncbi:MAG: hypothetical protein CM15mP40_09740 [Alphaproteobacteria bacterium]|nr:MAG: hypothetical protein CM15mP40_09740 [Alphaproteobacteria bacterium]